MLNKGYELIVAGLLASMLAQTMKFIGHTVRFREINFQVLSTTGGMPSAHSAFVCAMATSAGLIAGFESLDFAIMLGVALVVMYDAAGLRRAAGKMAASLNRMMDDFYSHRHQEAGEKLKELLGHTPFEVFVGATWGVCFAFAVHKYLQHIAA